MSKDDIRFKADNYDKGEGIEILIPSDTPENAACHLAIELFKQGVLHAQPE